MKLVDKIKSLISKKEVSAGPSTVLSCDVGFHKITFLEVDKGPEGIIVQKHVTVPKPKDLVAGLKEIIEQGGFSTDKVRVSLKGQGIIVRFIQFPRMKAEDLRSAMSYEVEKYIPFKASDVVFDFVILDEGEENASSENMNLLLVAAKKADAYNLLQDFQTAGLKVELIDIDALACGNAVDFLYPEAKDNVVALLDIGTQLSTLSVSKNGKPRFIRDISYGGQDITKRLKRKLNLSDEEANKIIEGQLPAETPEIQEAVSQGFDQLITDIRVSLDYFSEQQGVSESVTHLYVGGGISPALYEKVFSEGLDVKVQVINILDKVSLGNLINKEEIEANHTRLPVAFGLSVREKA